MKKISMLLATIMLFSMFAVSVSAEEDLPTIFANATKTENNTVELLLSISEGSNIAGCSFNVVYDSEKLTYSSHEVKETISSMMNFVNPEYNENAICVLWADVKELVVGGEIIKIVFTINDGASGTTEFVIDKLKMMNVSSVRVDCSCENPTVVLSDSSSEDKDMSVEVYPSDGEDNNDESSSTHSSSGISSGKNRPIESESTKEPINNEIEDPSDDENIDTDEETKEIPEDDYEVFLLGFDDVKETDWYFESIRFAKFYHLMSGVSETEFAPMNNLTRGMLVTILYRLEGEPECSASTFIDVETGMWYSDGIAWAAENKIVNGIGDNKFAPNSNITREQIALIMYNYSNLHSLDTTESKSFDVFKDSASVSKWAKDAVEWSIGTGLLSGKGDGILDPKGNATRAEIATILMRYVEKYDQNK